MKKKKWLNSKMFFTITMVFVGCCFMSTSLWAARKVEFYSANAGSFIEKLNQNESSESESIGSILGLTRDEAFILLRKKTDFNGVTHYRYQQSYKGIPVWGMHTNIGISPSNKVVRLHGTMVLDIPGDIKDIPSSLDPLGPLKKMEDRHKKIDIGAAWNFRNEEYGTYIYLHKNKKAHLCCVVSFFADTESGNPSQPIFFIDAKNGKVLDSYDMLRYADGVGPGGNEKIGYYYYGTDFPAFGVAEAGSTCTMDFGDVKTVDLHHGTSGTTPYSYTCYENTHKPINGAYCPLNDAQYFGQVVYDMYNDWYGVPVLPFQLTMRVHYSTNYEDVFWDGSTITFGDGYTTCHPLVALDISAHEVNHGFTELNSDLIYSDNNYYQPSAINEAFSDMAGEAAEYYSRGSCDYMFGYDIFKAAGQALRYLYDPPLDGVSIDHVDDYYPGLDFHYCIGIFNKAFYLIATSPGWTTRMAFDIFVKANQDYWTPSTNFQQGAEGAVSAAMDYGYPCQDAADAFAEVGINVLCCVPPIADFTCSPKMGAVPLTVSFTDNSIGATSLLWDFGDGVTSTLQDPIYTYTQIGPYSPALTVTNACGYDTEVKTDYIKAYCASSGLSQDYEYIGGVAVADLNNPSGPSPYSNFTHLTAHLIPGETVNVSLTPRFPGGGEYTECWTIWIDYNGNCELEEDEEVFSDKGGSIINGSFTVPCCTISGDTLMRVSMKWERDGCPAPCETFDYGEVEDYTANIANLCVPEADFTASTTTICLGDNVTFTDQSTGNPTSWSWIFEGGTPATSTQQNPTILYHTAGKYTVSLTVANACGSDTETKVDYITVIPPTEIYVYDITQTIRKLGSYYKSKAAVTIMSCSAPVANATVDITWSGVVSGVASGVTGANGTVTFSSAKVKASPCPFTITVDNVTHATLTYNPVFNNETTDTECY